MLQIPADQRLAYITDRISKLKLEFPQSRIAKQTGFDEGQVSRMLKNKQKVSKAFFEAFLKHFGEKPALDKVDNYQLQQGNKVYYLSDLIEVLKDQVDLLRKDIKANLNDLVDLQRLTKAEQSAMMQVEADHRGGDEEIERIHRLTFAAYEAMKQTDKSESNQRKG